MFVIKNLRKESKNGWTYLIVDFDVTEIKNPFKEKTMWISVEDKNEDMLTDDVYDAFVPMTLYLGMYYGQDVHIEGNMSPRLYHNIEHYLMKILDNFSDHTKPINFIVNGFKIAKKASVDLVATGISCGVDSLTTIYDNYIETTDKHFRINSLFLANCGTHGEFENEDTEKIWLERAELNKNAANELGLPMYLINSNFHAYTYKVGQLSAGFLAIYSCFIALQKYIRRYITSSALSYEEILKFGKYTRDFDLAEHAESYMTHLLSTEQLEIVVDGCQYTRAEKTERISNWDIAKKHLNVCINPIDNVHNCSCCTKCMRTLFALEAMGKLDEFRDVFDIETYHKNKNFYKYLYMADYGKDALKTSTVDYCKKHNLKFPSKYFINTKLFIYKVIRKIKNLKK